MNRKRAAFTLMEMLVVVALLGTLLGLSAAGMRVADNMAREARTRATIAKLNHFVMQKYADYQYRRVPGDTARERLQNLRKLMAWEMPDYWDQINETYSPRRLVAAKNNGNRNKDDFPSAEILYQIVMDMPEAESAFTSMEIADTDGNGLNEFVDGWGTPIYFIRWPKGHYDGNNGAISKIQNGNDPDPFDPQKVGDWTAVFPLIFSCGPDRSRGIILNSDNSNAGSPGGGSSSGDSAGASGEYYDNITNHNL